MTELAALPLVFPSLSLLLESSSRRWTRPVLPVVTESEPATTGVVGWEEFALREVPLTLKTVAALTVAAAEADSWPEMTTGPPGCPPLPGLPEGVGVDPWELLGGDSEPVACSLPFLLQPVIASAKENTQREWPTFEHFESGRWDDFNENSSVLVWNLVGSGET